MTKLEFELALLERQMNTHCKARNTIVAAAEAEIKRANRAFDRVAVPLAQRISHLRKQIETETEKQTVTAPRQPASRQLDNLRLRPHDPEWSQEDIDHFYELKKRGSRINGRL